MDAFDCRAIFKSWTSEREFQNALITVKISQFKDLRLANGVLCKPYGGEVKRITFSRTEGVARMAQCTIF
jgi:hypothetical protein